MGLAIIVAAYRALHTTMQVPKVFLSLRPPPYTPSTFPKLVEGTPSSPSSSGWKRSRDENNGDYNQQQQYHSGVSGNNNTSNGTPSSVLVHHDYVKEFEGFEEYLNSKGASSSSLGGGESGGGPQQLTLPHHFGTVRKLVTTSVAHSECSSSVEGTLDLLHGLPAIFIALTPTPNHHHRPSLTSPTTTQLMSFANKTTTHGAPTTTLLSRPQSTTTLLGRPKSQSATASMTQISTSQSTTPQQIRGRVTTLLTRPTPSKLSQPLSQPPPQRLLPPPPPPSAVEGVVTPLVSLLRHQRQQQQRMGAGNSDMFMGELLAVRRVGGTVHSRQNQHQSRLGGGVSSRPHASSLSLTVHSRFQVVPIQSNAWQRIYLSHNNTNINNTTVGRCRGHDLAAVFDMEILAPADAVAVSSSSPSYVSAASPPSSSLVSTRWITLENQTNRWGGGGRMSSEMRSATLLVVSDDCVPIGMGMFIPRGPNLLHPSPATTGTAAQGLTDEIESISDSD